MGLVASRFFRHKDGGPSIRDLEGQAKRATDRLHAAEIYTQAGELALELGKVRRAIALFRAALERAPVHEKASQRLEAVLFARGELRQAHEERLRRLRALTAARVDARTLSQAHFRVAETAEQLGDVGAAAALYSRAFELDPSLTRALEAARRLASGAGAWTQADGILEQEIMVASNPQVWAELLRERAVLKRDKLGNLDEAIDILRRAVQADHTSVAVRRELVRSLLRRADQRRDEDSAGRDRHEAADVLCALVALVPAAERLTCIDAALDVAPDHLRALELLEQLAPDAADRLIARWSKHVEVFPDSPVADDLRLRLARAHLDAGRPADAIPWYEQLVRGGDIDSALALAELHLDAGRVELARQWGDTACEMAPKSERVPMLHQVVDILHAGDPEGAFERARLILVEDPTDEDALDLCVSHCSEREEWETLERVLSEVAARPEHARERKHELLLKLARIRETRLSMLEAALETWRAVQAVASEEDATVARSERARLAEAVGDVDEMAAALRELAATARAPADRRRALERLGRLHDELGHAEEAFQVWTRVRAIEPADVEAAERTIANAILTARYEHAIDLLEELAEQQKTDSIRVVELHRRIAIIASQHLGDPDRAADALLIAAEVAPKDRSIAEDLRAALHAAERFGEESVVLRSLAALAPDDATRRDAKERLARVLVEKLRNAEESLRVWQQLVDETDDVGVLHGLADAARREDDAPRLDVILAKLSAVEPDVHRRNDLTVERAQLLAHRLGQTRAAIGLLVAVTATAAHDHLPSLVALAELCDQVRDVQALARALELQVPLVLPDAQAVLLHRLADLYEGPLDDSANAVLALTRWEEAHPGAIEPRVRLVPHLAARSAWSNLVDLLDRMIDIAPVDRETWVGTVLDAIDARRPKKDHELAALFLELSKRSHYPDRRLKLMRASAELYAANGRPKDAFAAAVQSLRLAGPDEALLDLADRLAPAAGGQAELDALYDRFHHVSAPIHVRKPLVLRHASLLAKQGRFAEALDRLLGASDAVPTDPEMLDAMEQIAPRARRLPDLLAAYENRSTLIGPGAAGVSLMLRAARACQANDRGFDMLRFFARAVELAEGDRVLLDRVELTARDLGKTALEHTMAVFEGAARKEDASSEQAADFYLRAARSMRTAEPEAEQAAFELAKKALAAAPTSELVFREVEAFAEQTSRVAALDSFVAQLIDETIDASDAAALLHRRARLLRDRVRDVAAAAAVLDQLWALRPDDPTVFQELRACLVEAGRLQDLIGATEREITRRKDPGQRLQLMRDVAGLWEEANNAWEALDAWKRVLASDANDVQAKEAIDRLTRAKSARPAAAGD